MSTESESQNPPTSEPQSAAPQEETPTVKCCTCDTTLNTDDSKLVCTKPQCRAASCSACTRQMIEVMFGQPVLSYPLRCAACSTAFDMLEVDQILTKQEYYEQYLAFVLPLFWSKDCLQENEKLAQCPFCPYMEIHTTDACALRFLTCQHPSCGKESCLICLHEITNDHDMHRNLCVTLQADKELIEKAIESGSQQHCPHCELRGLKDDGCTHMVCERCGLSWCYLCGMKEEDCPVDEYADQSLSSHNQEWESHKDRCPMSLVSINELDERWPDTDQECLEFFHRYRTLCQLYDAMKIIGEERFDELNNTFGIIDASGYTMDEIKDHTGRILISYPEENA